MPATREAEAITYLREREQQAERALYLAKAELAEAEGDSLLAASYRAFVAGEWETHRSLCRDLDARRYAKHGAHSRYTEEGEKAEIERRAEKFAPLGGSRDAGPLSEFAVTVRELCRPVAVNTGCLCGAPLTDCETCEGHEGRGVAL